MTVPILKILPPYKIERKGLIFLNMTSVKEYD